MITLNFSFVVAMLIEIFASLIAPIYGSSSLFDNFLHSYVQESVRYKLLQLIQYNAGVTMFKICLFITLVCEKTIKKE